LNGSSASERFGEVVLPHLADAFALARWLTGNTADAEDVVQEACLRAHTRLATFAGGNARAWMLTIVRNTTYTWLEKNRPSRVLVAGGLDELDEIPDQGNAGPEAVLIAKAQALELEAAIAALPHPLRETLVLHDINGLAYKEVASILDIPLGTVMSRLSRARARLFTQLGGTR
jgi:RNA polymerase sigma-70 factor, ECF subfamily